jgi:simple sugar transport system permease protein
MAVIAVVLVQIYLWRTSGGYEQRMAGQAPLFARFGGIASNRVAMRGMLISGALAGLAGGILALEVHYRMLGGFAGSAGWDGITAAILGQIHPIGSMIVSILFAGIRQGAQIGLQFALRVPREFGGVLIALIILFVASDQALRRVIDAVAGALNRLRKNSSRIGAERS